ncbi:response regulator [Bacteroides thetaiotaomicron]|uniref:hybrid sensor histidine kinase/response regulator transcription factor n=1 Tax=Bacteroides thetaiotaomicron TaxID=818 RepID=UPI002220D922|nr:hybrid sensor histidine kinase/response regulator transcription factor [Bacteroides thetaiotaomicron]UYU64229.1 response regulator [Bacteroides thetaiotaomicron]
MRYLSSILVLLLSISSFAINQYKFRLIDIVDGLSDNQIRGLSITPDGRIAVRTASIMNIYNGTTFEYFHYDKKQKYVWNYNRPTKEYYDNQGRIWMKELGYLLLLDLNTNKFNYNISEELATLGITKRLKNLFIDDSKNYWFLTEDNTFTFYDTTQSKLITIEDGQSDFTRLYGIPMELTQYKNLCWIVYSSGLIRCWDYTSHEFIFQETRFLNIIGDFTDRIYIHPDAVGNIWLMYNNAVYFHHRINRDWKEVATIKGISNFFTCMDMDNDGNVWVGTSKSGLRYIDGKTFEVTHLPGMRLINGGVQDNDIFTLFIDPNNGIWIGTLFQGLCYYHPSMQKFQLIQTINTGTQITNETIRCFLEEEDGTVLIGSGDGLYRFYPESKKVERLFKEQINDLCLSIRKDHSGRIWVGTYLGGFFCIEGKQIRQYLRSSINLEKDPNQNISRCIYEDTDGRFWACVTGGVGQIDPVTGKMLYMLADKYPEIKDYTLIYHLYPINDETFAAVGDKGIYYYNTKRDSLYIPGTDNPDFEQNIKYFGILKDTRGLEWFATEDGIRVWDKTKLYKLTVTEGLPNNEVYSLLEDDNGVIWASTLNGICKIAPIQSNDTYNFSIVNFGISDGLQWGKFYDHSALKAKDGTLYFGGAHGFNYFDPNKIIYNNSKNKPVLTAFRIFNSLIKEEEKYNGKVILEEPINKTKQITLKYNQNFITFEFAGMNYVNPSQTYYKYMLKNFDEDWNEISGNELGKATYTGLRPGKYNFMVYTANNDKVWGEIPYELTIIITPPFWATSYAIIIYIILSIAIFIYILKRYQRRTQKKILKEKEIYEQEQKIKLDLMKFQFFTNISHEFRTPLTLILTPLETLIKQQSDMVLKKKLDSIYQNAHLLLSLVNQLLDFRKLEIKGEKVLFKTGNIIQFIKDIYLQFKELSTTKNIDFTLETSVDYLLINYDHDMMYKIINNLLSNAFKFTPQNGHIQLTVNKADRNDKEYIMIEVSDTGCGIDEKDLPHIFERFYQIKDDNAPAGSGIGLHLVKEYTRLHNGDITVSSQINIGSTFTVYIPVDLPKTNDKNHQEEEEKNGTGEGDIIPDTKEKDDRKKLLVVEDNDEFRNYLTEQLSECYRVIDAPNGEEAEKLILSEYPDLIISDLMMPKMDGIELCQRVKSNIQTSHTPFILLTARTSDESKMEGYEAGADSYISKPFSFELLCIRIKKLIEQQENRKMLFHKTIEITPSSITTTSLDEELVRKALNFVEENIDNPEYSIEDLSKDLGLSKTHLNRKLQSIVDLTPLQFIRSIRLKRAAQLLTNSQYNINEISYMVGFNTLKYFNSHFKEEFQMTPSQYREKNKG